jgi:nucleoside phosphorylase
MIKRRKPEFAIVAATPLEFAAVQEMLESYSNKTLNDIDYIIGNIGQNMVVAMVLTKMGNNFAAIGATHLLHSFPSVRDVLMLGIAAGVPAPEDIQLGDLIISDKSGVLQYDNVKRESGTTRIRDTSQKPSARLIRAINKMRALEFQGHRPWEAHLKRVTSPTYARPEPGTPRVHYGRIGSGNTLLRDSNFRDELAHPNELRAIEMEGSGIADATWDAGCGYLLVRGVSDHADHNKADKWQPYAALVAAAYARSVLEIVFEGSHPSPRKRLEGGLVSKTVSLSNQSGDRRYQIDLNSLHELVGLFRQPDAESAMATCAWYWLASHEVTVHILDAPNVRLSLPGAIGVIGPYERLSRGLRSIVPNAEAPNEEIYRAAFEETKSWALSHCEEVRDAYEWVKQNRQFIAWSESGRRNNWVEHRERNGALYSAEFLPIIAEALGFHGEKERSDLKDLLDRSKYSQVVESASRAPSLTQDLQYFRDAYFISGLLRGRVHDLVAARSDFQIMHHHYRKKILQPLLGVEEHFIPTPVSTYLATIILNDSFRELSFGGHSGEEVSNELVNKRLNRWITNMRKAVKLNLNDFGSGKFAEDRAFAAARRIGISASGAALAPPGTLRDVVTTKLFEYTLKHWPRAAGIERQIRTYEERGLRELSKSPSGRLERFGGARG